jgi:hypothetical protein
VHGNASRSFALGFGNPDREDAIGEVGDDAVLLNVAGQGDFVVEAADGSFPPPEDASALLLLAITVHGEPAAGDLDVEVLRTPGSSMSTR